MLPEPTAAPHLKAYLLVLDSIPLGYAINSCAHAGTALAINYKDDPVFTEWTSNRMRKVTCKVSAQEFEQAKASELEHFIITESALDYAEVVIVFKPRTIWPKQFKFYKLYR